MEDAPSVWLTVKHAPLELHALPVLRVTLTLPPIMPVFLHNATRRYVKFVVALIVMPRVLSATVAIS